MMFDTSNAFAVGKDAVEDWDTFQDAVAQDMQARARQEGHIARMPSMNPDKPPPVPYDVERKHRPATRKRTFTPAMILDNMPDGEITAREISEKMGIPVATISQVMRTMHGRGMVAFRKGIRGTSTIYFYTRIK